MDMESIYIKLPRLLRVIAVNMQGWRINRFRYGKGFLNTLHDVETRLCCTEEELQSYRDQRLNTFIRHAAITVPYYRLQFEKMGIDPLTIRTINDLSCLPILSKTEVQQHIEKMQSSVIPTRDTIMMHTSGTTGAGLNFASTIESIHEHWAVWWRSRGWYGLQLGTLCGYFGGRNIVPISVSTPPYWVYNRPGRQILFSTYHMNLQSIASFVTELNLLKPLWLHGYPSALALLANLMIEADIQLDYSVRWITVCSETLFSQQADVISKVFGVKPIQDYGMTEAVACASECEMGTLHVDEDFSAVEFIPDRNTDLYKVVGTNFSNLATPLLRYDTGDLVSLGDKCRCGRPGRIISSVDGRQEDYVVLSNGSLVGRMDHVFKDFVTIQEARIYQKIPGEIELQLVKGKNYSQKDEQRMRAELYNRFGNNLKINIQYFDRLSRSKNGKLRLVISEIDKARLSGKMV